MATFVVFERTKARKKSQKDTVTLYFSVSARETILRCTYRDFHRAHCSLSSHTNPTSYIIDTSNSQCKPLPPLQPIRMQFMSEQGGTSRWGWLRTSCLLLSQLRCSRQYILPTGWPQRRPARSFSCGGRTSRSTEQLGWKSSELLAVSTSSRV